MARSRRRLRRAVRLITRCGMAEVAAHAAFDRRPFESLDDAARRYLDSLKEARQKQAELERRR